LFAPLKIAKPNPGHYAFRRLEQIGVLRFPPSRRTSMTYIARPGTTALAEISRQLEAHPMPSVRDALPGQEISLEMLPPSCPKCRGLLKADTVAFGEPIPPTCCANGAEHSERADLVILGGTSATVYPGGRLCESEVKERGGRLIEVTSTNRRSRGFCDLSLRGGSADVLPRLTRTNRWNCAARVCRRESCCRKTFAAGHAPCC